MTGPDIFVIHELGPSLFFPVRCPIKIILKKNNLFFGGMKINV